MTTRLDRRASTSRATSVRRLLPTGGATTRWDELRTFFTSAARHPRMIGAAAPTSRAVADTIGQVVPTTGSPIIVELGPGTGTLSDGIHRRLPAGARHIGIELGAELVDYLRTHKPWLEVIHGDACDLRELLDPAVLGKVDAVVSSLPWSLLDGDTQRRALRQITAVLAPHGAFTALNYLHARNRIGGLRFRAHLTRSFDEIITHTTWKNLPPIMHYICRRPL